MHKNALRRGVDQIEYEASHAIRGTEHVDISNTVDMYDRWL